MTTIEELRHEADSLVVCGGMADLLRKAASELEALQKEVEKLKAVISHLHENRQLKIEAYQERDSLRAQNRELRGSLEEVMANRREDKNGNYVM